MEKVLEAAVCNKVWKNFVQPGKRTKKWWRTAPGKARSIWTLLLSKG